jgi:hypothetical protein
MLAILRRGAVWGDLAPGKCALGFGYATPETHLLTAIESDGDRNVKTVEMANWELKGRT